MPACPGAGRAAAHGRRCGARIARRRGPGGGGAAAEPALGPAERPPRAAAGAGGEPAVWRGESGDPEEETSFPRSPSQRPGGGGRGGGAGESAAAGRQRRRGGEAECGGPRSAACAGNHELSAHLDPLGAGGAALSAERGGKRRGRRRDGALCGRDFSPSSLLPLPPPSLCLPPAHRAGSGAGRAPAARTHVCGCVCGAAAGGERPGAARGVPAHVCAQCTPPARGSPRSGRGAAGPGAGQGGSALPSCISLASRPPVS